MSIIMIVWLASIDSKGKFSNLMQYFKGDMGNPILDMDNELPTQFFTYDIIYNVSISG